MTSGEKRSTHYYDINDLEHAFWLVQEVARDHTWEDPYEYLRRHASNRFEDRVNVENNLFKLQSIVGAGWVLVALKLMETA